MNGKFYSIPFGMIFKKHYCSKCGARLERERTHRVVAEGDKDYYQYHRYGRFPKRDYDVYDYRMKCPSCGARVSYDEQCVIDSIQKRVGNTVLSLSEIKSHYKECKHNHNKRVLLRMILTSILSGIVLFGILYLYAPGDNSANIGYMVAFYLIFMLLVILERLRRYKGSNKLKHRQTYSYEKEAQLKRLHAYSSHNKSLIDTSQKCYCFYCKTAMDRREIKKYTDEGQTAICPECGMDSIVPDSIGETVDETIISEMNDYWF